MHAETPALANTLRLDETLERLMETTRIRSTASLHKSIQMVNLMIALNERLATIPAHSADAEQRIIKGETALAVLEAALASL